MSAGHEVSEELRLVELVSRVLDRGVVVSGNVVISVAGVDLVYLGLELDADLGRDHATIRVPPWRGALTACGMPTASWRRNAGHLRI